MATRRRGRTESQEEAAAPPPPTENGSTDAPSPAASRPLSLRTGDLLGKHRLSAAITRLDKEIDSLKKELLELETMQPSSTACKEVASNADRLPDALLPVTRGPENASWDRWFQRIRSSRGHKWWQQKGSAIS